jgi:hypothetical protein
VLTGRHENIPTGPAGACATEYMTIHHPCGQSPVPGKPFTHVVLFALVFPLLTACGVKFIYNKLDWLIPWYIDDYVSLNAQQELLLDERLGPYLARHRREQLPLYADFFDSVAVASEDGLDDDELKHLITRTEQMGNELFASIAPSFHEVFRQLSDAQIGEIRDNLRQKNQELEERYVEREAVHQRRARSEDMQKFLQRWLGELRDDQISMIEDWSARYKLMGPEFMQSRRSWQTRFYEVLELRADARAFEPALTELFSNRYLTRSPEHQNKFAFNENLLRELYRQLDASLDSYQRHKLVRELRDYAEDFRELSRQ